MGGIWWIYGIGLKGADAEWKPVPGRTVIQDVELLHEAGVLEHAARRFRSGASSRAKADASPSSSTTRAGSSSTSPAAEFGQAEASAGVFLEEEDVSQPASSTSTNVYEIGGEALPEALGDELDQIAFWHKPHYTLVEVAPFVPLRDRARSGADDPRDRHRPASASTCTWSATSARCASRRPTSASARRSCSCAVLAAPPARPVRRRATCSRKALPPADPWASTCRSWRCWSLAIVFGAL